MNLSILGASPRGQALASVAASKGHDVLLGSLEALEGPVPHTTDLRRLAPHADLLLVVLSPSELSARLEGLGLGPGHRVLSCARGLDPDAAWISEMITRRTPCLRVGALGGPAISAELLAGLPTANVVASPFDEVCRLASEALHCDRLRLYPSRDLRGVELAGAMVQILSTLVGLVDASGLGAGVRGAVMARGLAEASRLAEAVGADPKTLSGLIGVGDLVATTSAESHPDYAAGLALARGEPPEVRDAIESAAAALALAKRVGVDLPLTQAIDAIAAGRLSAREAAQRLMSRAARPAEL